MTDEKITGKLPGLDVEIVRREDPAKRQETMTVHLQATPTFETVAWTLLPQAHNALSLFATNPFAVWSQMAMAAWSPWLNTVTALPKPEKDESSGKDK